MCMLYFVRSSSSSLLPICCIIGVVFFSGVISGLQWYLFMACAGHTADSAAEAEECDNGHHRCDCKCHGGRPANMSWCRFVCDILFATYCLLHIAIFDLSCVVIQTFVEVIVIRALVIRVLVIRVRVLPFGWQQQQSTEFALPSGSSDVAGMNDYITKPVDRKTLDDALSKWTHLADDKGVWRLGDCKGPWSGFYVLLLPESRFTKKVLV